jgi:hypothetical protein
MKRLQIFIEEESDEALAAEALKTGTSKAAIIRRLVAQHTGVHDVHDPIDDLVGVFDDDPGGVDATVYGP